MSAAIPKSGSSSSLDSLHLAGLPGQGSPKGAAGAAGALAGQLAGLTTAAPTLAMPHQEEQGWTISTQVYQDPKFTKTTVADFFQLQVPEQKREANERLVNILFDTARDNLKAIFEKYSTNSNKCGNELTLAALQKKLNENGRQTIQDALSANIDASAANMVFFNTNQGPRLLVVNTQNTYSDAETLLALQVSNGPALKHGSLEAGCNGYCEAELFGSEVPDNDISRVALGEPSQLFANNQIPSNPMELVSRILLAPYLKCQELYVNVSVAKMNETPIALEALQEQVNVLNTGLGKNVRKDAYQAAEALRTELGELSDDIDAAIAKANAFVNTHGGALTDRVRNAFEEKIQAAQTEQNPINFLKDAIRYGVMDHTQLLGVQLLDVAAIEKYVQKYQKAKADEPNGQIDPVSFDNGETFNAGYGHLKSLLDAARANNSADLGQGLVAVLSKHRQALNQATNP